VFAMLFALLVGVQKSFNVDAFDKDSSQNKISYETPSTLSPTQIIFQFIDSHFSKESNRPEKDTGFSIKNPFTSLFSNL
jgi:hypothetical protein